MKRLLLVALAILSHGALRTASAQTYCEPGPVGITWCSTAWSLDDITVGAYSELNQGCNGSFNGYTKNLTSNIAMVKGAPTTFTLASGGTPIYFAIWVDCNGDGDFTDATDYFWNSSSAATSASGNIIIPSGATATSTRMRIASRTSAIAQADECIFGYQAETQDFSVILAAAGSCPVPTNLTTYPNVTSALLSWDSAGTQYNVQYGLKGFTPGGPGATAFSTAYDTASIFGLTANTDYQFYVQTDCALQPSGDSSAWNGPHTFKTLCTKVTAYPYTETFDDSTEWIPNSGYSLNADTVSGCWSRIPQFSYNHSWLLRTGSTSTSNTGPSGAYGGSGNYLYVESFGSAGDTADFNSPIYDLTSLTAPYITFKYHMFGAHIGDLFVEVSSNGGQTWTTVDSIKGQQQTSETAAWLERGLDVTAYKSADFMLRFRARKSITQSGSQADLAIDHVTIGEAPSCFPPSGFTISNITGSSADMFWTSNESAFYLEIGPQGFTQGTGNIDTATTTSYNYSNLASNTYWDVYIRTDCSANGNGISSWAGPYSFRTLLTPTWLENFDVDGFVPNVRWSEGQGLIANPTTFTSTYSGWGEDGWLNNGYDGSVRCNISSYSGSTDEWFFTEAIDLGTGNTWELHFDAAVTIGGQSGASSLEADDTLKVVISTDNGLTWSNTNTIFNLTQANNLSNNRQTFITDLAGYTGVIRVGFYMESTVANSVSTDLFVDNIGIRAPSPCPQAWGVNATNVGGNDATINWSANTSSATFLVEYGPAGYGQGTGTKTSTTTQNSMAVSNLQPLTAYHFYVLTICGTDTVVSNPAYVLTGCPAVFGTPYSETFELLTAGSPPASGSWNNCWTTTPTSTSQYRWQTDDGHSTWANTGPSGDHTTGTGIYMYTEASSSGLETEAIFGPVDLSQSTNPTLSFWYHMFGSDMGELHVDFSTDQTNWIDAFTLVGQQQTVQTDPWLQAHLALSQFTNDTVYFRFRGIRGTGSRGDMAIDDIVIDDKPNPCIAPTGLFAANMSTTSADLFWGSYEAPFSIEWGPIGFTPGTGQGTVVNNLTASTYPLTGLSAGLGYDFYVRDTCNNTWVGPHTFFTACNGTMAGTYTVNGPAGSTNFTSLNDALLTLTNCGMSGAVTLNLMNVVDTGSYTIGTLSGISATNTLTINGSGNDSLFAYNTADFLFEFDGAEHVTLNNMNLFNLSGGMVVWLHNGASHITIQGCTLYGQSSLSPSNSSCVVGASNVPTSATSKGDNCYNVQLVNNSMYGAYSSVSMYGDNQAPTHSLVVKDNIMSGARYNGVRVYGIDSVSILGNTVMDMNNTTSGYGAYISYVNEVDIQENNFVSTGSGLYLSRVNEDGVSANSPIINNMLAGLSSYGRGIYATNAQNLNIYHNSTYSGSNGLYVSGSGSGAIDVRNNIFYSTNNRAVYTSTTTDTTIAFNYNVYEADYTSLAFIKGNSYIDLAAWQTAKPNQNANSVQGNPGYLSATDLHVIGALPNNAGDNTTNILVDIDGDTRPASGSTTVDIGADEYTPLNTDVEVLSVSSPVSGCGDSLSPVVVKIRNLGIDTLTTTNITVNVTGDISATLNTTYNGNLAQFEYDYVQVGTINTYAGAASVNFEAYSTLAADQNNSNDTAYAGPYFFISVEPAAVAPDTTCFDANASATFYSVPAPGVTYGWYANQTDTTPVAVSDSFAFPMSGQTNWYLGYETGQEDSIKTHNYSSNFGGNAGIMFDVIAHNNLEITSFSLHADEQVGDTGQVIVYILPLKSYVGYEKSPNDWILVDTITYVSAGQNTGTFVSLPNSIQMPIGATYGIYLQYDCRWSNGPKTYTNSLMTYKSGVGFYSVWSNPSNNRSFDGVIYASTTACSNTKTLVELPFYADTAIADFNAVVTQPDRVDVDATASQGDVVDWNFGDGTTATGVNATHTYVNGGSYTVTCIVTDTVCGTTDTLTEDVLVTIGINENELLRNLEVFPNPSAGVFNVSFKLDVLKEVELEVVDQLGRVLYSHSFNKTMSVHNHKIDLSNQANGLYFIRIKAEALTAVKKITKM